MTEKSCESCLYEHAPCSPQCCEDANEGEMLNWTPKLDAKPVPGHIVKSLLLVFQPKCTVCYSKPATHEHTFRIDGDNQPPRTKYLCDDCAKIHPGSFELVQAGAIRAAQKALKE